MISLISKNDARWVGQERTLHCIHLSPYQDKMGTFCNLEENVGLLRTEMRVHVRISLINTTISQWRDVLMIFPGKFNIFPGLPFTSHPIITIFHYSHKFSSVFSFPAPSGWTEGIQPLDKQAEASHGSRLP